MANYSGSLLVVNGPGKEIDRFLEAVRGVATDQDPERGDRLIDFARHLPEPEGLHGDKVVAWRNEHWGTKWVPQEPELRRPLKSCIACSFYTAYAPPKPWLRVVAAEFSELDFELTYDREGSGDDLHRTVRIVGGTDETEGYVLFGAEGAEPDWRATEREIEELDPGHLEFFSMGQLSTDAIDLNFGDWDDLDEDEQPEVLVALKNQLRADVKVVEPAMTRAKARPIRRSRQRETSHLIGALSLRTWRSRLTEHLTEAEERHQQAVERLPASRGLLEQLREMLADPDDPRRTQLFEEHGVQVGEGETQDDVLARMEHNLHREIRFDEKLTEKAPSPRSPDEVERTDIKVGEAIARLDRCYVLQASGLRAAHRYFD